MRSSGAFLATIAVASYGWLLTAGAQERASVEAPLAIESLLVDGAVVGSKLVVVGERGHVLISSDNAGTWSQSEVPTRAMLTAVHMHDEHLGWAVGHDAVILRTRDGGLTWKRVHYAPEEQRPLLDVWFRDERHGFAVGAYGYFLSTDDAGDTWKPRAISEDDFHLNAIAHAADGRLYIAAEAGSAYRSDDGGDSWSALTSPYEGSFFGALPLDDGNLLLFGLRGHLFHSGDRGETWRRIDTGCNSMLTDAIRVQSDLILITGLEGTFLISRDHGRSVSLGQLPGRRGIASAVRLADGGVLLIGEFGVHRLPEIE